MARRCKVRLDLARQKATLLRMMLALSLIVNVAVTFSVVASIWRGAPSVDAAFGPDTPARRILACVYATIGMISLYALAQMFIGNMAIATSVALTLLPLQMIYKLMTAAALSPRHPVVVANLAITLLHAITMFTLL